MQRDTAFVKQQVLRCREYQRQKSVLSTGVEVLVLPADRANGVSDKGFWLLTEWALAIGKAVWLLVVGRSGRSRWHWGAEISTSASNESKHTHNTTDGTEINCYLCLRCKQKFHSNEAAKYIPLKYSMWNLLLRFCCCNCWCLCKAFIFLFDQPGR